MNFVWVLEIENIVFRPNIYVFFIYNYRKINKSEMIMSPDNCPYASLILWYDISIVLHYDATKFVNTCFCSSEILKPFKAKHQSKTIQRFKHSNT